MTGGQRGEKCAGKIVTAAGKIDRVDAQSVQMAARSFGIVIAAVAAQLDHDVFRAEPAEDLRRGGRVIFAGELPGLAHAGQKVVQMCKIGCDLRKRSVRRGRGRVRSGQRAAGPRPPQHLRRERAAAEQAVDAHELCLPQKLVRYVRVAEGGVRAERGDIGGFVVPLNQIYDRSRAALRVDDKRVRVNAAALQRVRQRPALQIISNPAADGGLSSELLKGDGAVDCVAACSEGNARDVGLLPAAHLCGEARHRDVKVQHTEEQCVEAPLHLSESAAGRWPRRFRTTRNARA